MSLKLSDNDRTLFGIVDRLIGANPFGDERVAANRALFGRHHMTQGREDREPVTAALEKLRTEYGLAHADYGKDDRYLLQSAMLFCAFHESLPDIDQHIRDQEQAGKSCCPAPFGTRVIATLTHYGFRHADALRYLALFFQLRRAFYFINNDLLGESPCMRELRCALWEQVFTRNVRLYEQYLWTRMEDFSVLLLGPTGTGKGAAAAALGRSGFIPFDEKSDRFAQSFTEAFVSTNLSEFTASLVESEVFGHRRGAFTGAVADHDGVLARCSRYGAVFLDEIGDVPLPVQIKLLRVLQERTFTPVGGREAQRFHGRVLAATNQSVDALLADGRFREDFYYRLCSDRIVLPPLSTRIAQTPAELPLLIGHILKRLCGARGHDLLDPVHHELTQALPAGYPWHGNVRELEQAVRRVLLRGAYQVETATPAPQADDFAARATEGQFSAESLVSAYCQHLYGQSQSYSDVARRTQLDWRTVKRHVLAAKES
jgi:DNA-binding NtrC family response regulator